MSFFHRRTRSASAQRPQTPASSSAHQAAAQAFLANRVSQPNLSASAAAAALRSMSPPPTSVNQVQTKRMLQRQNSGSSTGSASRGRGRGGVVRKNSSGSMTERTFRSPSPGRPPVQGGPVQAPPVPKLPDNFIAPPPIPAKSQRRSASMDYASPRVLTSPPSINPAGHGQSAAPQDPQRFAKAAAGKSTSLHQAGVLERQDSRNSINFSYPRPNSPPAHSPTTTNGSRQLPKTMRNGISSGEAEGIQYDVTQAAEQPVKRKKKKAAGSSTEGSHFQSGSMGSKPIITPLAPGPDLPSQTQDHLQPTKKKKKKVAVSGQSSHFPSTPTSTQPESDSDSTVEKVKRTQRASGTLMKQPSVVKEDWDGEQEDLSSPISEPSKREEPDGSPMISPASIMASKRGTAEANMSRKMEEPVLSTRTTSQLPPVHQIITQPGPESDPAQGNLLAAGDPQHSRTLSLSPSRSTRFSDRLASDLASGRKHEPLPRSVSPAKSALKHHSPSSQNASPIDPSFPRVRGSSVTPSEASDSNVSADGSMRRKKFARVSFEPEVAVVGMAAESVTTDSPTLVSPQNKDTAKKGWFGLGKGKSPLVSIPSEDDLGEGMQPRPQLPSFGSVRGKNRQTEADELEANTPSKSTGLLHVSTHQVVTASTTSSETSLSSNLQNMDQSVSSDHVIGGLLAQEAQRRPAETPLNRDSKLPLPPEVTSVEGTGYASDTDSEEPEDDHQRGQAPGVPVPVSASSTSTGPNNRGVPVPTLSVQPPTPGLEQGASDQWLVAVPGGFPASSEDLAKPADPSNASTIASTGLGIEESHPSGAPNTTPLEPPGAQDDSGIEDSDVDNASIYSDAEEDLSYLEGDGFGSINAIVESPAFRIHDAVMTPPESPLARVAPRPEGHSRTTSWEEAQARWSGIAQKTREGGFVQPTLPLQQPTEQPPPQQKTKKKKKNVAAMVTASAPAASARDFQHDSPPRAPNQGSAYPPIVSGIQGAVPPTGGFRQSMRGPPVTKSELGFKPARGQQNTQSVPAFKQSMRSQPAGQSGTGFKQSMRPQSAGSNEPGFRKSLRGTDAARPESMGAMPQPRGASTQPVQSRAALQKKHIPPTPSASKPVQAFSNDSDSESSFKKSRKGKAPANEGRYSMRSSMRAAAPAPALPTQPGGRGGVRSLSPVARRPFSPVGEQKTLRTSMRGSMDAVPTLRNQPTEKKSSSLFGGSRKAKSPTRASPLPLTTKLRSRFADSDDEDEPRSSTFRSRFEDSSDEEPDSVKFTPVRGIPRKIDEGDSTDLDDSSDEEKRATKPKSQPPLDVDSSVGTASPVSVRPLSPNTAKKKGLFSRFRGKKEKDESSKSKLGGTIAERNAILERYAPTEATKDTAKSPDSDNVQSPDTLPTSDLGFKSTAERDALVQQTMAKIEAAKAEKQGSSSLEPIPGSPPLTASPIAQRPGSPLQRAVSPPIGKLQRRVTPQRMMSDSWPLPPKLPVDTADRPSTSDAVPTQAKTNGSPVRPAINGRQPTSETLRTEGGTSVYGRTGKKKRFPMLRKAFGLMD